MSSERIAPIVAMIAALAAAGCAPKEQAASAETAPSQRTDPATLVATGEPRRCIGSRNVSTTPAGDSVLMFRTGANRWFRNDLRGSCPAMNLNRVLVFRPSSGQHCEMDRFDVVDPVSGMNFGSCALGQFTPVKVPRGAGFSDLR